MGGGKGASTKSSPYETQLAGMSKEMYDLTSPLRSSLIKQYEDVLGGNYNFQNYPTFAPQFANMKQSIEGQYANAKENILANTMRGGGQQAALGGLETARAGDLSGGTNDLINQIASGLLGQATGTAWQTPQVSLSGLSSASNTYGQRMAQQQALAAQGKGGLGSGIGSLLGMGIGTAIAPGLGTLMGGSAGGAVGGSGRFF